MGFNKWIKIVIFYGHDPGQVNQGGCIIRTRITKGVLTWKILHAGMQNPTFNDLKGDYNESLTKYLNSIMKLHRKHKVDYHAAERYMNRGPRTSGCELVSFALGALNIVTKKKLHVYPAVTWKNAYHRSVPTPLKVFYKKAWKTFRVPPHLVDAFLIAAYQAYRHFEIVPYKDLKIKEVAKELSVFVPPKIIKTRRKR